MSDAVLILQRAHSSYASWLRVERRRLEKAEPESDDARAAVHNIETLKVRMADLDQALKTLGAAVPEPADAPL